VDNLFLSTLSWITSKKSAIAFCAYIHNFISDTKNRVSRETEELKGKKRRKEAVGRNYGERRKKRGGFDKKHEKSPKERSGDGCAPSYRGREKTFLKNQKRRCFELNFLLPGGGERNRRDESTAKVGIKNLLP